MFKLDLENAVEPEIKLSTSVGSSKKQESSRKTSTVLRWLCWSLWICGSQQIVKFVKRWEYKTTWPASWEICMQVKKLQLELDMERWLVPNQKRVHQGCILSPCLFNLHAEYIMWNVSLLKAQAGIKIARRKINNLRYAVDTTLTAESKEELKNLLMKVKEESEKVGLKLSIQN